jgi:hypothetical protein
MPGIVFQANAEKIVNRPGGYPTTTVRKELDGIQSLVSRKKVIKHRMVSIVRAKGSDYVVFTCPAPDCKRRNKKSVYEAKAQTGDGRLSFKCVGCYREIEVQRPIANIESPSPVTSPEGFRPGTLFGPNGRPIGA